MTQLLVEELDSKLISAITLVLTYCDEVKIQIQMHRKLRSSYVNYIKECEQNKHKPNIFQKTNSKAQTCINIENQLKDKLPQLLQYLSTFVSLLQNHSNRLYLNWLKQQIGERSLHEFEQLRNPSLSNEDAQIYSRRHYPVLPQQHATNKTCSRRRSPRIRLFPSFYSHVIYRESNNNVYLFEKQTVSSMKILSPFLDSSCDIFIP